MGGRAPLFPVGTNAVRAAIRAGGSSSRQESRSTNPVSDSPGSGTRLLPRGCVSGGVVVVVQLAVSDAGGPRSAQTALRGLAGFRAGAPGGGGIRGPSPDRRWRQGGTAGLGAGSR